MNKNYREVIIVGSGPAGLITALTLAEKGIDVFVVEKEKESDFGNNWINDLEVESFDKYNLPKPLPDALVFDVESILQLKTINNKKSIQIKFTQYSIIMSVYQKFLVQQCKNLGVKFEFNSEVINFINEGDFIKGITLKKNEKEFNIESKILILACGNDSSILKKIPTFCEIDINLSEADKVFAIQELWSIDLELAKKAIDENKLPDCEIICYTGLAGAYSTLLYHLDMKKGVFSILAGSQPHIKNVSSPRNLINQKIKKFGFCIDKKFHGEKQIPLRYSVSNNVSNGLVIVGDAALMVNPHNGSGTLISMIGAKLCANELSIIIKSGDKPSKELLWRYNYKFQTSIGYILAGYYISFRCINNLCEEEIQKIYEYGLIQESDFLNVHHLLPVNIGLIEAIKKIIFALPLFPLLLKILISGIIILRISYHYKKFPKKFNSDSFLRWKTKAINIIDQVN